MEFEKQIHAVLHSGKRENWAIEGEFQVAVSLAAIRNMEVYIWRWAGYMVCGWILKR